MVQVGLDFTLLIQIVQFLLIVFIVKKLILDPIYKTITKRDEKINSLQDRAQASLDEIEAKKLEYESKLQAVRTEISDYHNQLKGEAGARTQAIIDSVKAEANSAIEAARAEIKKETDTARAALQSGTQELTQQIVASVTRQ